MTTRFKQCKLYRHRNAGFGEKHKEPIEPDQLTPPTPSTGIIGVYTCWLPEEFAKIGKVLDLKRGDDTWTRGWTVVEVYNSMSEEYVREHERDHLTQHKASEKLTPNKGLFKKP